MSIDTIIPITNNNNFPGEVWLQKAKYLYNIKQQIKDLTEREKELSQQMKDIQQDEAVMYGGFMHYYEERVGSVDYSAIPELKDINLNQYRKPSVKVWKLVIKMIS